jgi:hypothetical protein
MAMTLSWMIPPSSTEAVDMVRLSMRIATVVDGWCWYIFEFFGLRLSETQIAFDVESGLMNCYR